MKYDFFNHTRFARPRMSAINKTYVFRIFSRKTMSCGDEDRFCDVGSGTIKSVRAYFDFEFRNVKTAHVTAPDFLATDDFVSTCRFL
ncbi:hypothetical protein D3C72_2120740 [compost metagenome]